MIIVIVFLFFLIIDNGTLLASTCDELYLSGVFLNTTYLLESGGVTYLETCGFSGKFSIMSRDM